MERISLSLWKMYFFSSSAAALSTCSILLLDSCCLLLPPRLYLNKCVGNSGFLLASFWILVSRVRQVFPKFCLLYAPIYRNISLIITKIFAYVHLLLSYHHFLLYATFDIIYRCSLLATSSSSSSSSSIFAIVLTPITLMLLFSFHDSFRA